MYGIETLAPGYARLFEVVDAWARKQEAVRALFIHGSLAHGTSDAYSDLDLLIVTDSNSIANSMADAGRVLGGVEPFIIENHLESPIASILSVVTDRWHRVDVAVCGRGSPLLKQPLITVFDLDSIYEGPPVKSPPEPARPDRVAQIAKEFLRVLGLSVVVLGRKDVHAAHEGANLLRGMLIDLFLMESPVTTRSSAKKLLPALTAEQQALLRSLPPLADDHDRIAAYSTAIADLFLPRARGLLESVGGKWPEETENATRRYLEDNGLA